ncbi:MAG: hypothetical protein Q7T57_06580 [Dehalococcoidales bacterium]|nr:hypothetical protein [Dehalococcoidales bacterium]
MNHAVAPGKQSTVPIRRFDRDSHADSRSNEQAEQVETADSRHSKRTERVRERQRERERERTLDGN